LRLWLVALVPLWGCTRDAIVVVTNDDSVELNVRLRTSNSSLSWERALKPGATAKATFKNKSDTVLRTWVTYGDQRIDLQKGYFSGGAVVDEWHCVRVSRSAIRHVPCK